MSSDCPVCKKTFFPVKAAMELKSKCLHCKSSLITTKRNTSSLGILVIVGIGSLIRIYLETFINEYITLFLMVTAIWIYGIFTTEVHQTYEIDS